MPEEYVQTAMRRDADLQLSKAIKKVVQYKVPGTVQGSTAYHRSKLADLLPRVKLHRLPNFFLTLTANEVSET